MKIITSVIGYLKAYYRSNKNVLKAYRRVGINPPLGYPNYRVELEELDYAVEVYISNDYAMVKYGSLFNTFLVHLVGGRYGIVITEPINRSPVRDALIMLEAGHILHGNHVTHTNQWTKFKAIFGIRDIEPEYKSDGYMAKRSSVDAAVNALTYLRDNNWSILGRLELTKRIKQLKRITI